MSLRKKDLLGPHSSTWCTQHRRKVSKDSAKYHSCYIFIKLCVGGLFPLINESFSVLGLCMVIVCPYGPVYKPFSALCRTFQIGHCCQNMISYSLLFHIDRSIAFWHFGNKVHSAGMPESRK